MADQMRPRGYNRLPSRQDELEQSRSRHEQFRSSMFSSTTRPPQANIPTLGANSVSEDSVSSSGTISRIDAAIMKARAVAVDAENGQLPPFSGTPQISGSTDGSSDSSNFQMPPAYSGTGGIRNTRVGTGSYAGQMEPLHELGGSRDSEAARVTDVWRERPRASRVDGIPEVNGVDEPIRHGVVGGGGNVPIVQGPPPRKSPWERVGSVDTSTAARYPGRGGSGGGSSVVGSTVGSCVFSEDDPDIGQDFSSPPPRDQKSSESSSVSGGATMREGAPEWTPDHLFSNNTEARLNEAAYSIEPDESGDLEISLTPRGYEDPLELPDGNHHISFSKFLEVMTGPGLRVRKHHRAGKGNSGLRVLRYIEEEDILTWDSHKILGAAQHVLPMADVEELSMQPDNRVVLTCVGGRDSYAVFEAANEDAAAVLYVGLERLRKRTAAQNYL